MAVYEAFRGGVIVSCQARADNPLHGSGFMAAMAQAAQLGGAVGIRANGPDDIAAITAAVSLPVVGILKDFAAGEVYITPTREAALRVADAGAAVVAVDASDRPRSSGLSAAEHIQMVRQATGLPVMADVDTLEAGLVAWDAGAELVATTLSGFTAAAPKPGPDLVLVEQLAGRGVRVVAEGGLWTPDSVRQAFDAGAFAVVVGTAITNPWRVTERFVAASAGFAAGSAAAGTKASAAAGTSPAAAAEHPSA